MPISSAPCTTWPRASIWTKTARRWTRSARSAPAAITSAAQHTQANFKTAFWRSDLLDYKPFETWDEEGARDTQSLAAERVKKMLGDYQQPGLDPAIAESLTDYVARKKAAEPDAFI